MVTNVVGDDAEARFERLYRQHVRDVYRYALAVVRDPADAEDLTQATFLRAWRAFRDGVTPRTPQNWFLRIAHNVLRTHFRTQARRPWEVELIPELAPAAPPNGASAAEVLEALGELPLTQREALVMRELEGRSYAEIAQILGVSRSAVEALVFRARTHLRVQRSDLRRIATVPLPASLTSFSSGGAGVGGLVTKAAAVVAAGVVAVGVGREPVEAVVDDEAAKRPAAQLSSAKPLVRATRGPVEGVRGTREVPPKVREERVAPAPEHAPKPSAPVVPDGPPVAVLDDTEPEPPLASPPVTPPAPPDQAASAPTITTITLVPEPQLPQPPAIPLEAPGFPALPPLPETPELPPVPLP